jgi:hypothetical protein
MKDWPEDETKTIAMEDAIEPICKAVRSGYTLRRNNLKSIPYDGYNVGVQALLCGRDPTYTLSEEGLAYHKNNGRDLLNVLMSIAFQIGFENGQRFERKDKPILDLMIKINERFQPGIQRRIS